MKKRSGSKKSNGVEARTSKTFDPDTINSLQSGKAENGNGQSPTRTSLPVTKEEPTKDTSADDSAVNGEQTPTDNKQSEGSSDTPQESVTETVEKSDSSQVVNSEENTQQTSDPPVEEDNTEEEQKPESTTQGPLEEEDLDEKIQKEAEESQKEAKDLKENQIEESEELVTKEEESALEKNTSEEPPKESLEEPAEDHTEEQPEDQTEDHTEEPAQNTVEEEVTAEETKPEQVTELNLLCEKKSYTVDSLLFASLSLCISQRNISHDFHSN